MFLMASTTFSYKSAHRNSPQNQMTQNFKMLVAVNIHTWIGFYTIYGHVKGQRQSILHKWNSYF